eukprot:6200597-Pleurochrysis_carterae.AAC.2
MSAKSIGTCKTGQRPAEEGAADEKCMCVCVKDCVGMCVCMHARVDVASHGQAPMRARARAPGSTRLRAASSPCFKQTIRMRHLGRTAATATHTV